MKYYLCGPIDSIGNKEINLKAFKDATYELRKLGYIIVSPIETPSDPSYDYLDYIKEDLHELIGCGAIIMLPGWPQSRGAKGELQLAMYLKLEVYYYIANTVTLIDMNFH